MRERRKKIDPIVRLIEVILDFALTTGFPYAVGFLLQSPLAWSFDPEKN
jgi:hypothetical protein